MPWWTWGQHQRNLPAQPSQPSTSSIVDQPDAPVVVPSTGPKVLRGGSFVTLPMKRKKADGTWATAALTRKNAQGAWV